MKRAFNQAIFERILVGEDGKIIAEFAQPFNILIDLENSRIEDSSVAQTSETVGTDDCSEKARNPDQIFFDQGFIKRLLVEIRRIELLTSALRTQRSPS